MSASTTAAFDQITPSLGEIEPLLQDLLTQIEPDPDQPRGRGRPRILPSLCLWAGMLVCVLRGFSSQLMLWRLISQLGLWDYPRYAVSDQAVYKRLAQDGTAPLEALFAAISGLLAQRLAPYLPQLGPDLAPFASTVVAIDETTLDPVARALPSQSGERPTRRIPGKLAGAFDLRLQQWRRIRLIANPDQNEKVLARELVAELPAGSLILADLGYFGFAWFDDLTAQGHYWISRVRAKTSYTVVHTFAQERSYFDGLVWLGANRSNRAAHLVRLVRYEHHAQLRQYITNVRNPEQLPLREIAALYARRWDIELAIKLVKQHLGVTLWWSTRDVVIQQQLLAALSIAQIVQALRLEIAARAGVEVFDVSLPLLVRYLPQFAARGEDPVALFVERGRAAGFIRPARRVQVIVPEPPLEMAWTVGAIDLWRTPRYPNTNNVPRRERAAARRN